MKESCIEKEVYAVDEEYCLALEKGDIYKYQAMFSIANHPFNKFTMGNKDTLLHSKIREELVNFYEKYYSSNIMNVVLYSDMEIK